MCDTDRMRLYLPATLADLAADAPPRLRAFTAQAPADVRGDDLEVLEDEAQDEAALESLRRLRDDAPAAPPRRLVLALDLPLTRTPEPLEEGSSTGVLEVDTPVTWSDVVAFLLDGEDAEDAVRTVLAAEDQDRADAALAELWDHALQWFDASERPRLVEGLAPRD